MNALVRPADLSPQEAAFVRNVVRNGKSPGDAALAAGYTAYEEGWQLLRRPRIAAAVHHELQRVLTVELAPVSLRVLRDLLEDTATPARTRADIGRHLLQMAGYGQEKTRSDEMKPLSEMSADEMRAYLSKNQAEIDRIEAELASRAKDVSAPIASQPGPKPLNYLD